MPADDSGSLQKQFGEMRAEFLTQLGEIKDAYATAIQGLTREIGKLEVRAARMEGLMSETAVVRDDMKSIRERIDGLERWKERFEGEKRILDSQAEKNEAFWRRLAGGLLAALIIAVAGAAVTTWKSSQVRSGITAEEIDYLLQPRRETESPAE